MPREQVAGTVALCAMDSHPVEHDGTENRFWHSPEDAIAVGKVWSLDTSGPGADVPPQPPLTRFGHHHEVVAEVEMDDKAVLIDVDSPDKLMKLRAQASLAVS